MQARINPLKDLVGDLFVDRQEELDYFWKWATRLPSPMPHDSHAILGRRRTGKTTMLAKLFNRLFYEQDKVMPVYVTFERYLQRPEPQITWSEFSEQYLIAYLRSYLAFRYRQPTLMQGEPDWDIVRAWIEQTQDPIAKEIIDHYNKVKEHPYHSPISGLAGWAVALPSLLAEIHNMPTAIMIDEFQVLGSAYNEEQKIQWGVTSLFQKAAEAHWAPLLVSGSVVSSLKREIFGGALAGRFAPHHIPPLPRQYAIDLVFRLGERNGVAVNEEVAEAIHQVTGGSANAITCIVSSASPAIQRFPAVEAVDDVVAFELSDVNGKLGQFYDDEFNKYNSQLQSGTLIQKVMFAVANYPGQDIHVDLLAKELNEKQDEVHAALETLYRTDIIGKAVWTLYIGPSDPMLCRYIQYTYRRISERLPPAEALKDWKAEYAQLQGRLNHFTGEVGEVYLQGVMDRFDGRTVEGNLYFNQPGSIVLPKFRKVERRGGIVKGGIPIEIDLHGEWQDADQGLPSRWLVQVKTLKTRIGDTEVQYFLDQCQILLAQQPAANLVRWYFSKSGFTQAAIQLLKSAGVLYSDRQSFNPLAKCFDFFGFPP